jgi:hypothetical protein
MSSQRSIRRLPLFFVGVHPASASHSLVADPLRPSDYRLSVGLIDL